MHVVEQRQRERHCRGDVRAPQRADGRHLEGKPDGDEPVGGEQNYHPGRHVQANKEEEHDGLAADVRRVQQLEPADGAYPRLEGAQVEHARVGARERAQVEVQGRAAHARAREHGEGQRVAEGAEKDDGGQAEDDQCEGDLVFQPLRRLQESRRDVVHCGHHRVVAVGEGRVDDVIHVGGEVKMWHLVAVSSGMKT